MIRSALILGAILLFGGPPLRGAEERPPVLPVWIWTDEPVGGPVEFAHESANDRLPERAVVRLTGDFCHVELRVNDQVVGFVEAFDPVTEFDILPFFQLETNTVSLVAYPVEGPSAVAATLTTDWGDAEGVIDTNSGWSRNATVERGFITPARWGDNTLSDVTPVAEYNQWKEAFADASAIELSELPEGFQLETIRFASEEEDSWVSLAIDEKDRFYIGMENKGILRLTPGGPTQKIKEAEVINEDLEECRGLVFHRGALYANANDSKALYRLRDTTGDDQFDEVILLQETNGSVGHGRNDLAVGPDWTVHAIHGDSVELPGAATFDTAAEAATSNPLGHWVSIGREDKQWKIHARGLRNPYGLDFNDDGEAFTYDADNEGDVGLPFYRPSRINHLVRGANYGWWQRPGNTRSFPVYAPDSVPTTFDVGRGSPTAVKFGYRSHFPAPWRDALFVLDWAYGRIIAVHLAPRGASYYASGSEFLAGRPLNVTDLAFDSAGAMYFITGGRKTRSALFRIRYQEDFPPSAHSSRPSQQAMMRDFFSLGQREIRKRLETNKAPIDAGAECWEFLGSADPWMRNAARIRLEKRPLKEWREFVELPDNDTGTLTALLALVRQGDKSDQSNAIKLAVNLPANSWLRTEKLLLLRIAELSADQPMDEEVKQRFLSRVGEWLGTPDTPVTREVVRTLALYGSDQAPRLALDLFTASETQEDKLYYLERLSETERGWSPENRTRFFKSIAVARQTSRGDRFMPPFFQAIEERALAALPEEDQPEFAALLKLESLPLTPTETTTRKFIQNWSAADFDRHSFTTLTVPVKEEGLSLYRAGLCHHCHTFGTEGMPVGPDLTRVASRFSSLDLTAAILHPSEVISGVYRNSEVELKDGTRVIGRLMRDDFRESILHFSTNPFDPTELTPVPKSEIVLMTESEISPMPPNLLSTFTKEEVISLIQWLLRGPETP